MANLPETPQWEDGIYQIEVSDPVLGGPDGISNRQAKQLAKRTSYLKQQVEKGDKGLADHIAAPDPHAQYAPKESPALTGTPTAPTAVKADNSTKLATTGHVKTVVADYAPLASPGLTGKPTAPTAAQTANDTQLANTAFVKAAIAALVASSPEALDTLNELAAALGNDPNFATTMTNALAGKQPLDNTLTELSGKSVSALLNYLGLGDAAKLDTGNSPGEVVTAGSDQPVYNSTLPTSGYTSTDPSGYMGKATVTGGDTLVRLIGLIARNVVGNWTLVNSYGSHFGTGGSIQPEDAAHVLVSTDGAGYTRRWYFYNNGTLRGPAGDFGDMAWVNNKVGTVDGVITLGNGINVKKVAIPDLPLLGYTDTSSRGILATATGQADSVTKAHSIQLTKPGAGGWGLTMSWGTYVGASGSVDDVAHLLCASDGAAFSRRWWLYNNGDLVGPGGKFYSEKNTIRTADGTLKAASPVVKIFSDGRFESNAESEGASVERLAVGEYLITGCKGLNSDAAWGGIDGGFDVPVDRNKQPLVWLDYMVNADGSVLVKTYHRTNPDAPAFARNEIGGKKDGDPVDIPADQFVSVRVEMVV